MRGHLSASNSESVRTEAQRSAADLACVSREPGRAREPQALLALDSSPWISWGPHFLRTLRAFFGRAREIGTRHEREEPVRARRAPSERAAGTLHSEAFCDVGKLMQVSDSYEDAFGMVRRRASAAFPHCDGALYLVQESGGKLELKASWGREAGCGDCFDAAECRAMRTGDVQLAASDMACARRQQSLRSPSLCVPIKAHGAVLGVLMLQETVASGNLVCSRSAAEGFSDQIALAVANMRLRDTLRRLSGHDPLADSNHSSPVQPVVLEAEHRPQAASGNRKTA